MIKSFLAAIRGYTMIINSLVRAHANKNAQDNSGNTALIWGLYLNNNYL
jgi:ankyrin repeat protein